MNSSNRPLWTLVLFSFAGYLLLAFWFPLFPYFNHFPLHDIQSLAPSLGQGLAYGALLCLLFVFYGLAYRHVRQEGLQRPLLTLILGTLLFSLPLLFTYPYTTTDIYRYYLGGRISAVYGQSPLEAPPAHFPDDPYMVLAGEWGQEPSPYGPVWETAAAIIAFASGDNLWLALLLLKSLAIGGHVAATLLIWRLLANSSSNSRTARTLLWAWNPALLLIFAVNGHNDSLMLFWLLLALWVQRRGWPVAGLILMTLAPLTKAIGLLALPFFYIDMFRLKPPLRMEKGAIDSTFRLKPLRIKIRAIVTALAGSLALFALFFLPFGSPLALAQRLQQESTSGGGFSLTALIILAGRALGYNPSISAVTSTASLLFILTAVWLLWRSWYGRSALAGTAAIFAAYLIQAFRFRIWYAGWIFPWLLLVEDEQTTHRPSFGLAASVSFLLTSQLSVLIYGHFRLYFFNGDQLIAHLVGVPFTFALPLVLALFASGYNPRSGKRQKRK